MSRAHAAQAARWAVLLTVAGLFVLPLAAALVHGLVPAFDAAAWRALHAEPALGPALALSVFTALVATALSLAVVLVAVPHLHGRPAWQGLQRALGPLLSVPHAAYAVGLALLLMPSGLPARLLAIPFGWDAPPDVATLQDPWGLGLALALAGKETPFLLWCTVAQLARGDVGPVLQRQLAAGRTLGYPALVLWWRVVWPQLLPRLGWPLAAVAAYALTVVDMAVVLGPARPPTLAVLAWDWLRDPDPLRQQQGAAAALLLAGLLAGGAAGVRAAWPLLRAVWLRRAVRGQRPAQDGRRPLARTAVRASLLAAGLLQVLVLLLLALASVVPAWPFPALLPPAVGLGAWQAAWLASEAWVHTVTLGLASAASGLLLALLWLEASPPHWDRRAAPLILLPLWWPGLLLAAGLYRGLLPWGLDGTWTGVWLAHGLSTAAYAWIALAPAHRSFDGRYQQVARALGRGRLAFLLRVKWPMLLGPLAAAFAVAFAVSVAQYTSTLLVGAGRWPTLTTEALALAAGGQRDRVAAFALLQAVLPALVFALAALAGRRAAARMGGAPGAGA